MNNYLHFIAHVNRLDLTIKCLKSCKNLWANTIIVDNSSTPSVKESIRKNTGFDFNVIIPSVPLNTAQTYNLFTKIASEKHCDFFTYIHNDAEIVTKNGDLILIEKANNLLLNNRIGMIAYKSGNDDLFCAYKTEAVLDIGGWDDICFPFYYLDIDFIDRLIFHQWQIHYMEEIEVLHHNDASSTIKSDNRRFAATALCMSSWHKLYLLKKEILYDFSKLDIKFENQGISINYKKD